MRVGRIVKIEKNPISDKLYNEQVDMGNGEVRGIASGLQKHMSIEDLQDRLVLVLANLKPKKLAEYMSHGMILCPELTDPVVIEMFNLPEGTEIGDRVGAEGFEMKPLDEISSKVWERVKKGLSIDEEGNANFNGALLRTEKGVVKAPSIKNGVIN